MSNRVIWIMLLASLSLQGFCQGHVNYDYLPSSSFKDKEGNRHGSGNLQRISGRYTIPLSKKLNERNQPTAWGLPTCATNMPCMARNSPYGKRERALWWKCRSYNRTTCFPRYYFDHHKVALRQSQSSTSTIAK